MIYLIAISAVVMVWALLRILGDERQKRVQAVRATIERELELAAENQPGKPR